MSGEGQFREQAKKQWEKLDAEGHKIIKDLPVHYGGKPSLHI